MLRGAPSAGQHEHGSGSSRRIRQESNQHRQHAHTPRTASEQRRFEGSKCGHSHTPGLLLRLCAAAVCCAKQSSLRQAAMAPLETDPVQLLVQHPSISRHVQRVCSLLCVSKTLRSAVAARCSGQLVVKFAAYDMEHVKRFTLWLEKHGHLLKSLQLNLNLTGGLTGFFMQRPGLLAALPPTLFCFPLLARGLNAVNEQLSVVCEVWEALSMAPVHVSCVLDKLRVQTTSVHCKAAAPANRLHGTASACRDCCTSDSSCVSHNTNGCVSLC